MSFSQVKEHMCADCGKGYVEAAGARRCKHNKFATGGGIWWWLSAEETFSTILKLVSDPVATVGPEGVCITFISATIPELLLSLPIQKEDQIFI